MNDIIRPDEVLAPRRDRERLSVLFKDMTLLFPNLVKLLTRLVRDPRVPRRSKVLVGGVLVYLVSPIDLVPGFIPVLGMADDVLLAVYAVNHLISRAGEEVVVEHWDGPQDLLAMVRSVLDSIDGLIPQPVKRWIDRLGD